MPIFLFNIGFTTHFDAEMSESQNENKILFLDFFGGHSCWQFVYFPGF